MKMVTAAVLSVCILLSACSAGQALPTVIVSDAVQSEQASVTPEQTSEPSPSPSPSPVAEPTEYEAEAPLFSGFTMEPNEDTVIIAEPNGTILFGYSDGRWLTHSQAAAYCGVDMKFYSISLDGRKASVKSRTAELREYEAESSVNNNRVITYDYNKDIALKLDGKAKGYICRTDSSFTFIQESYDTSLKEDAWFYAIRGVADVNGDGICEILTENEGWEYWGMYLCFIEDNKLVPPMIYDWVS